MKTEISKFIFFYKFIGGRISHHPLSPMPKFFFTWITYSVASLVSFHQPISIGKRMSFWVFKMTYPMLHSFCWNRRCLVYTIMLIFYWLGLGKYLYQIDNSSTSYALTKIYFTKSLWTKTRMIFGKNDFFLFFYIQ